MLISGKGSRYYGCVNARRKNCTNALLVPRARLERVIIAELKESILTPDNVAFVYKQVEQLAARGLNKVPEFLRKKRAERDRLLSQVQNYLNFVKAGNFSKAVSEALKEAEAKSEELGGEIEALEYQRTNRFKAPPREWVEHRLAELHGTLSRNTAASAGALKELLGTVRLEPVSDQESDLSWIVNGEKRFKPYYLAHLRTQTLALLTSRDKGSTSLQMWTRLQSSRTAGLITARIRILPVRQPPLYQRIAPKARQLQALGMTPPQIARALGIDPKTALKACTYSGQGHPSSPFQGEDRGEGDVDLPDSSGAMKGHI